MKRLARSTIKLSAILFVILASAAAALAQKHEIAITSGALRTGDHDIILPNPGFLRTGTGFTYQVSYAQRFFDARVAALYFEFRSRSRPARRLILQTRFRRAATRPCSSRRA